MDMDDDNRRETMIDHWARMSTSFASAWLNAYFSMLRSVNDEMHRRSVSALEWVEATQRFTNEMSRKATEQAGAFSGEMIDLRERAWRSVLREREGSGTRAGPSVRASTADAEPVESGARGRSTNKSASAHAG